MARTKGGAKKRQFLRHSPTKAENILWKHLRNRQLHGYKFRRQESIGPYVADLLCFEARLVVEVDGGQHGAKVEYDTARTRFMEEQGVRVIRFWNHEVLSNLDGVLTMILQILKQKTPSPGSPPFQSGNRPLPQGEVKQHEGFGNNNLSLQGEVGLTIGKAG